MPDGPEPRRAPHRHEDVVPLAPLREEEPHWFNVPNLFTFLRALLVPVILWLLTLDGRAAASGDPTDVHRWWAFGIFVFAAATDSIDGWVARRWYGVTRWGQLADPIADKLLIIGSLASLAAVGELPWWAVALIVVREVGVTLLRVSLVRRLDLVMPASGWGKSKTISQVVAVAAYLWPGLSSAIADPLLVLAVLLTLWSGIEYAFRAGRLAREALQSPAVPAEDEPAEDHTTDDDHATDDHATDDHATEGHAAEDGAAEDAATEDDPGRPRRDP